MKPVNANIIHAAKINHKYPYMVLQAYHWTVAVAKFHYLLATQKRTYQQLAFLSYVFPLSNLRVTAFSHWEMYAATFKLNLGNLLSLLSILCASVQLCLEKYFFFGNRIIFAWETTRRVSATYTFFIKKQIYCTSLSLSARMRCVLRRFIEN